MSNHRQSGFSLVEAVFAVAVIILVGLAVNQGLQLRKLKSAAAVTQAVRQASATPNMSYTNVDLTCAKAASYDVQSGATVSPSKVDDVSVPDSNVSAILAISSKCGQALVSSDQLNVKYSFCSKISLYNSDGTAATLNSFAAGSYFYSQVQGNCLASMQLAPVPASCAGGYGGGANVYFVASNDSAHSVVYEPTGGSTLYVERYCPNLVITDSHTNAITLANLSPGEPVELTLTNDDWIKTATVLASINATP